MSKHNNGSNALENVTKIGLSFFGGLTVGYLVALFAPKNKKEEQKETIEETMNRVKDVYETTGEKARVKYEAIKENLTNSIKNLKESFQSIDRDKYKEELEKVLDQAKNDQKLVKRQVDKLRDYFVKDFDRVKKSLS